MASHCEASPYDQMLHFRAGRHIWNLSYPEQPPCVLSCWSSLSVQATCFLSSYTWGGNRETPQAGLVFKQATLLTLKILMSSAASALLMTPAAEERGLASMHRTTRRFIIQNLPNFSIKHMVTRIISPCCFDFLFCIHWVQSQQND